MYLNPFSASPNSAIFLSFSHLVLFFVRGMELCFISAAASLENPDSSLNRFYLSQYNPQYLKYFPTQPLL